MKKELRTTASIGVNNIDSTTSARSFCTEEPSTMNCNFT